MGRRKRPAGGSGGQASQARGRGDRQEVSLRATLCFSRSPYWVGGNRAVRTAGVAGKQPGKGRPGQTVLPQIRWRDQHPGPHPKSPLTLYVPVPCPPLLHQVQRTPEQNQIKSKKKKKSCNTLCIMIEFISRNLVLISVHYLVFLCC